ncbi:MAG: hypothetical protein ACFFG0_32365 [Candidatus Thorarchaeota archaeon]
MVHINKVKSKAFTMAPGIMFPVLSYTMLEIKPINEKIGIVSRKKNQNRKNYP